MSDLEVVSFGRPPIPDDFVGCYCNACGHVGRDFKTIHYEMQGDFDVECPVCGSREFVDVGELAVSVNYLMCHGVCPHCLQPRANLETVPQRTQYGYKEADEDDPNWFSGCQECIVDNERYWDGMWAEYYRDCL